MPSTDRFIRINAPIERVWEMLIDVPAQPLWMHDLKEVVIETPGPLRVGSVAIGTVRMFGLSQSDPIEVTALDRPTRYGIAHRGAFRGHGTFRLTALGAGVTVIHWHESLHATLGAVPLLPSLARLRLVGASLGVAGGWMLRVSDPLLGPIFELVFRADLRRLKRLVEAAQMRADGDDPH